MVEIDLNTGTFGPCVDAVIIDTSAGREVAATWPFDVRDAIYRAHRPDDPQHPYSGVRLRLDGVQMDIPMMIYRGEVDGSASSMTFSLA